GERVLGKVAARHARLIGNHEQAKASVPQHAQSVLRAVVQLDGRRVDVIGPVAHQRSVLVQEHRPTRSVHGHDVSFIGRTMTSGMTVSSGWERTNTTVLATFIGS